MSGSEQSSFLGDLSPQEAYEMLSREPKTELVDVRTHAELAFVGGPDLSSLGKSVHHIEWSGFPGSQVNPDFLNELAAVVEATGCERALFLCRSGVRSLHAAKAGETLPISRSLKLYNVAGGFEGKLDPEGRRGRLEGWKVEKLPWRQN